jgi:hypothetical protein
MRRIVDIIVTSILAAIIVFAAVVFSGAWSQQIEHDIEEGARRAHVRTTRMPLEDPVDWMLRHKRAVDAYERTR